MQGIRIFLLLLLFPALSFAQYKIVLKSGKVIEGKYLHEDQSNIYVESGGIKMNFRKTKLDLEKMKELNATQETPAAATNSKTTATPKSSSSSSTKSKKPARVYTSEDLESMKQIWNEGSTQTGPATQIEPSGEEAQTQIVEAQEVQSQPMPSLEPRDEQAIREEIESTKAKIADTEKQIKELRAKGRVTVTWEKMVAKMQQRLKDLDIELKETIAARKAAKAAEKSNQTQPQP